MGKVKSHQKLPTAWTEREYLRNKGQFWTPAWVADAMISYVSKNTDLIFDPATGRGAFYEALLRQNNLKVPFYGIDIDTKVLGDGIYSKGNCYVEQRDFIMNPPHQSFKAIVANPPYIRHHRIDKETKNFLRKLSVKITGQILDGRAGYHIYFFIQGLNILEKGGRLAFIMPADTCEGKFAKDLWKWISKKFCIECVITFDEKATPFPKVDTNAIVFMIKNTAPDKTFYWVKADEPYSTDLFQFIDSNFTIKSYNSIKIVKRQVEEGVVTGLSRMEQNHKRARFYLNDFATVMRGIATGSNEFFFLTAQQVQEFQIPKEFLKRAIGRTKDAAGSILTGKDIEELEKINRPAYLLSINKNDKLPKSVLNYLNIGEKMGLPDRPLIKQRKPWYKMEKRGIPPILFAYLGRRNSRFIRNDAGALPLTGFLCVYPIYNDTAFIENLWGALNHPDTLENLKLVGKSYGSGAIKVEPGNLNNLPIPDHIVKLFNLKKPYKIPTGQLELFPNN